IPPSSFYVLLYTTLFRSSKLGVGYAVIGHSERRQYHAEDDALVGAKAKAALAADITPIVCVGEGLDVRQAGEQVPYTLAQVDGRSEEHTSELQPRLDLVC